MVNQANRGNPGGRPIDYYAALYGRHTARVTLDGGTVTLSRPGLGQSYHMDSLGDRIQHADLPQRVKHLREWLRAGGIEDPDGLSLGDIIKVTQALQAMLPAQGTLPFQIPITEDDDQEPTVDYTGRELAVIVHALAEAYGWGLKEILDLPKEVALAHAQEILITDRRRREWSHMLSEVAWGYNKTTGKSEYIPLPPPSWERIPRPGRRPSHPVPEEIHAKYDPKGTIIDLTKSRKAGNAHDESTNSP